MTLTTPLSFTARSFRRLLFSRLEKLTQGEVVIESVSEGNSNQFRFGDPDADLSAKVTVHNPRFYRRMVLGGGLGAAESLFDGDWECDDLTALVRIFIRNMRVADRLDRGLASSRSLVARGQHWLKRNTPLGAKRNIHKHYDLGNEFFALFLDDTMNYSSGVFPSADCSMEEASLEKMDRICRKLDLKPTDHLLEIGSGWGGLAIHAAEQFGCRVTTTTISAEQYRQVNASIKTNGLEDRVQCLQQDYRHFTGSYDKIVSVEMIEAVGHRYFDTYFRAAAARLKPKGAMLMQAIVIGDDRYQQHLRSVDFIRRYVFPGGCLPSISVLTQSAAKFGLRLQHLEEITPHYAETLRRWRTAFTEHLDEARTIGFSEHFLRLWNYYFCYCEAAFEERQVGNVQILLAPREHASDGTKVTDAASDGEFSTQQRVKSERLETGKFV